MSVVRDVIIYVTITQSLLNEVTRQHKRLRGCGLKERPGFSALVSRAVRDGLLVMGGGGGGGGASRKKNHARAGD